jgi:hypothetical protein
VGAFQTPAMGTGVVRSRALVATACLPHGIVGPEGYAHTCICKGGQMNLLLWMR